MPPPSALALIRCVWISLKTHPKRSLHSHCLVVNVNFTYSMHAAPADRVCRRRHSDVAGMMMMMPLLMCTYAEYEYTCSDIAAPVASCFANTNSSTYTHTVELMSTMTVTLYRRTSTRPERFDLIMVLPHAEPKPTNPPSPLLFSSVCTSSAFSK